MCVVKQRQFDKNLAKRYIHIIEPHWGNVNKLSNLNPSSKILSYP